MKNHIKELLTGFAIGTANIIPGVSGGTFLLIFGIYERVITALNGFSKTVIVEILNSTISLLKSPSSKDQRAKTNTILKQYEVPFLIKLMIGAGAAIVGLSSAIKLLLLNYQTPTYGLFFGLILVSIIVPFKLFKKKKLIHILPFLVGTAITIFVASGVDPVEKIQKKSDHYKLRIESEKIVEGSVEKPKAFKYSGVYSGKEYIMAGVAGAIAISAMVLPGISGSLVLILLGQYFSVLTAISGAKSLGLDYFLFLGALSIGMAVGLLLFVKLVNYVFDKFHDGTVATLTGLITGSLVALWPFKESVSIDYYGKVNGAITFIENGMIHTNKNILPQFSGETAITCVMIIVGIIVMIPFIKHEK